MTKFVTVSLLIASLSVSLMTPAAASTADESSKRSFTRDGETYVYTATEKDDHLLLVGHSYPSGSSFRLVVRGDHVSGRAGGQPVSFVAKAPRTPVASNELASR
ncbi:hypothetical protein G4G27_03205 [Sphingomonas sp. So64.6b]|nr:hypothetical protein G4G27_03205 [Sphingomonas sp. So64.6b]